MKLDYNPATGDFVLSVPRKEADPTYLMREYGLDFSDSASTVDTAVLFTREPYAAVSFFEHTTPRAKARLLSLQERIEASWAETGRWHFDMPADRELWPFQGGSVGYVLDHGNALVGDQPGLGKTPIAIVVANTLQCERVLVVCPASIRRQWGDRIQEWSTMPRDEWGRVSVAVVEQANIHPDFSNFRGYSVVSWNMLGINAGMRAALMKGRYDLLILDEAHYAKNHESKRSAAVFGYSGGLLERAEKVVALTGTPLPNRPREAYVLARGLWWDAIDFMSQDDFNDRFNPIRLGTTPNGGVWQDERVGRAPELQNRLRANFMVRHLKRDVMPQLEYPEFDLIRIEATSAVKAALEAERLLDIDPENLEGCDAAVFGHIAEARRLMGIAMAPQVADYMATLVEGGEDKLVAFYHHRAVGDILEKKLGKYGCVRVDGQTSPAAKQARVKEFIDDLKIQIILGELSTLGTGTDGLQQVCSHGLLAEPDWVHGNNEQCFDRLDRGGQRKKVQGDIFVVPGSLSERVLAAALRKGGHVEKALDRRVSDEVVFPSKRRKV